LKDGGSPMLDARSQLIIEYIQKVTEQVNRLYGSSP